ncbi:hypothetical protein EV368DRAFT_69048 [Lentinula lateritia]|nr:hypothetical protein EV368DRAFT_69048 [Lentinula lateritia]
MPTLKSSERTNYPVNGLENPGKHPPPESEFDDADDGPNVDPDADLGDDEYEEEDEDGEDYEEEDEEDEEEDPDPDHEELSPNPNLPAHPGVNGVGIGRGRGTFIRPRTTPQLGVRGGAGGGRGRGHGAESPLNGTENGKNQGRNSLFNPGTSLTVTDVLSHLLYISTILLLSFLLPFPILSLHIHHSLVVMPIFHCHHLPPFNLLNSLMSHKLSSQVLATSSHPHRRRRSSEKRWMQREEEAVGDLEDDSEDEEEEDCGEDDEVLGPEDDDEDLDRRRQRRMKVAMMRKRDDEEEEVMTEEQKMEQGKRMFEQGGFAACREKVAQDAGARGRRQDRSRNVRLRSGMRTRRQKIRESNRSSQKNLRRLVGTPKPASTNAAKAQQTAPEEEQRKRREERVEREALRKAQEFEKAKKEEGKRKRKEEERKKRIKHILILNVRAMSEQLQTTGKCKHTKFLPLNEPPLRRGVVDRTCFHVTPVYYLGWYIPGDEIPDYYPEAGGEMPTFWTKEVMIPWVRDYDAKYKSNERHCYFRPELAYVTGTKEPHLLVFISSNRTQEFIDMSQNEQFIKDAARIAHVKDFFGEVRWIRR